jgi:hypothetical protein
MRVQAITPRRLMEGIARLLKGDQVLSNPDHVARAAYEARMIETIAPAEAPAQTDQTITIAKESDPDREAEKVS